MKKLNINPVFKNILELYGINIDSIELNSDGSLRCGSIYDEGYWTFSSSKEEAYQVTARFIDEDEKILEKSTWIIKDNSLVKIHQEII